MVEVDITSTVTHGYIPDNGPILYPAHKNVWSTHPLDKSVGMIHAARGTCLVTGPAVTVSHWLYGGIWPPPLGPHNWMLSSDTSPVAILLLTFTCLLSIRESKNQPFWGIGDLAFIVIIVIQKFAFLRYI